MPEKKKITYPYNGETLQKCNKCGKTISFHMTKNKKFMPVNYETREPHWADCSDAGYFRKKEEN